MHLTEKVAGKMKKLSFFHLAFSIPLCKVAYTFRLVSLIVSFQPFTNKVVKKNKITIQYIKLQ